MTTRIDELALVSNVTAIRKANSLLFKLLSHILQRHAQLVSSTANPRRWGRDDEAQNVYDGLLPEDGGLWWLVLHIDKEKVRQYYDVGAEINLFCDVEELADKCRFYLANYEKRKLMARRAHERCIPTYSYHARANEISEKLNV